MVAQKLGNEDAALYRFTHPTLPNPPAKAHPRPALSTTVVERNTSAQGPSSAPNKVSLPDTQQTIQKVGERQTSAEAGSSQSTSKQPADVGSPSRQPRKQTKPAEQYAAGNAKVPIMLTEIKVWTASSHLVAYAFRALPTCHLTLCWPALLCALVYMQFRVICRQLDAFVAV